MTEINKFAGKFVAPNSQGTCSQDTMDGICIHPGRFTDRDSLDNLLEPVCFDVQDLRMTKNHCKSAKTEQDAKYILVVGNKQYRFVESFVSDYHIYVEEKQDTSWGRNDVAEMVTNQGLRIFGDAIALRPMSRCCRSAMKVDLTEFATELMRVVGLVDDASVALPANLRNRVLSSIPNLDHKELRKNMGKLAIL